MDIRFEGGVQKISERERSLLQSCRDGFAEAWDAFGKFTINLNYDSDGRLTIPCHSGVEAAYSRLQKESIRAFEICRACGVLIPHEETAFHSWVRFVHLVNMRPNALSASIGIAPSDMPPERRRSNYTISTGGEILLQSVEVIDVILGDDDNPDGWVTMPKGDIAKEMGVHRSTMNRWLKPQNGNPPRLRSKPQENPNAHMITIRRDDFDAEKKKQQTAN